MKIGSPAPKWAYDAEKYDCRGCGLEVWYTGVYPDDPNDDLCPDCYQELVEDDGTRYSPCEDCNASIVSQYIDEHGNVIQADAPLYCEDCAVEQAQYRRRYFEKLRQSPRHGYIYLLESSVSYWKIGRSGVPVKRIRKLEVVLPFDIEVDTLIETADMYALESELHRKYEYKRIRGEWFALNIGDVTYIRGLVNPPVWWRRLEPKSW